MPKTRNLKIALLVQPSTAVTGQFQLNHFCHLEFLANMVKLTLGKKLFLISYLMPIKKSWKKSVLQKKRCTWRMASAQSFLHASSHSEKDKYQKFNKTNLTVAAVFPFVFRQLKAISTGTPATAIVLMKLSSSNAFCEAGISGFVSSKMQLSRRALAEF